MSRRYEAGIVDAHDLLATTPSVAIPPGFGPLEHPCLLGCPIPMAWPGRIMMAAAGRDAQLLSVFEHELSSIALLDGHPLLGEHRDAGRMFNLGGMSQTLKRWLRVV